ncbi:hypothetical protein BDD43_3409 [Mucilaginibacter gracilis]|uniref:Uncharacterized protein n=1 Tax=Mucilaginibacter gracilis TaxID=423350 RepID=A0A495J2P3_9SPHI|nr:hypothetical protein [Mucilaginibacter gracilis]RKR83207.1 hypothetical protein BDD43_3409 [Mucilaginibacter gracilis]
MKKIFKIVLAIFAVYLLSVGVFMIFRNKSVMPKTERLSVVKDTVKEYENHKNAAYIISKNYVSEKLSHATSTSFPFLPTDVKSDPVKQNYMVYSYVEAEVDGSKIKREYHMIMHFNGGDEANDNNWTINALNFN